MLRKQEGETEETAIKSSRESLPENGQVGKARKDFGASSEEDRAVHGKQGEGSHYERGH